MSGSITKIQTSQEHQRGFQLHDSVGAPVKDSDGRLVFEIVYESDPVPADPQDGSGNRWVLVWDNDLKHTTEVSPHVGP